MGASSSTDHGPAQSPEQQEEESLAASTGSLPFLRTSFAKLSSPDSTTIPLSSLQEALSINIPNFKSESELLQVPEKFSELLSHLGSCITSLFFKTTNEGMTWVDFLRGFNRCCVTAPVFQSLNVHYQLFSAMCHEAGIDTKLEFDLGENGTGKVSGSLKPTQLVMFLSMCWVLMYIARVPRQSKDEKGMLVVPDVTHLFNSALVSAGLVGDDGDVLKVDFSVDDKEIPVQKLQSWALSTVVGISHSLSQYMQQKIQSCAASEENAGESASASDSITENYDTNTNLLTRGRAWAVSLSLRGASRDQLMNASFIGMDNDDLLYRSSLHGKGLSRFWSNVEGYTGPILLLISASLSNSSDADNRPSNKWIIGVLTEQGFENRDTYSGSSAYLFAIDPIFRAFPPLGKEKNYVYCHLHPTVRVYQANPKPIGLAFGGSLGNERISLDEDFAKVVVRHHAVDKTYQPGPLFPSQGFLPSEAEVFEVEVWGLGGESVKRQQDVFKKRENIFTEQRRKVDLKTFGNWEDSPEKMMMDMVSDPNRVRREDR
ncbi:hypothetical protein LUZ61_019750 [Rhynchospora tenuis]|uniref:TLDc domain-containing protein n=1 Tax=Rhynchospora tenuis TaxID=198213 RepID=A0AAD6ENE9_9POAL|nr:hypothetical protein LUZ61_019750 [Rhynchospora tenuis]